MRLDVGPGQAGLVLDKSLLEHICLTYTVLGDEQKDYDLRKQWHSVASEIKSWLEWNEQADEED